MAKRHILRTLRECVFVSIGMRAIHINGVKYLFVGASAFANALFSACAWLVCVRVRVCVLYFSLVLCPLTSQHTNNVQLCVILWTDSHYYYLSIYMCRYRGRACVCAPRRMYGWYAIQAVSFQFSAFCVGQPASQSIRSWLYLPLILQHTPSPHPHTHTHANN